MKSLTEQQLRDLLCQAYDMGRNDCHRKQFSKTYGDHRNKTKDIEAEKEIFFTNLINQV